jgi:N-acyl-D-amino-acid deacylase
MIGACAVPQEQSSARSTIIVNAQVADGTGAALRPANVRIVGDRIERIGAFEPQSNDTVLDARGLVLAPGFIDMHNHSDEALEKQPLAQSQIAQGITSIVLGLDGYSPYPIGPWLEARRRDPAALNLTAVVGHASIREQVMQKDFRRAATAAEVERMVQLVDEAVRQGAVGISSGVEYDDARPGRSRQELRRTRRGDRHW